MFGKISNFNGIKITISLSNRADYIKMAKYLSSGKNNIEFNIDDRKHITILQRRKIYAMFHDISQWSGYTDVETKETMKYDFIAKTGYPEFSLSDVAEDVAGKFIDYLIMFCLKWDIPFKTRTYDMIKDSYWFQLQCIKTRHCCICGKHGDIDHLIGTVGMGRNRRRIDNTKSLFDCVCRIHHNERHKIGAKSFMLKYHIKPVKLTAEDIKKLHIGGYGNGKSL